MALKKFEALERKLSGAFCLILPIDKIKSISLGLIGY
ncbi:hypothetical protein GNIT_1176 [Glaciecola nitratireducens FR1064]|uniref:Uncharacterized protein n=1 Tax=Glaciecola nitratireducens (strain JCM 12485 / KCTC 12276 / FR1064) TaxID=1085623 RepID=G4QKA4_GLANF|nr:hypothetical protein GNIT_1176 [Glaciecola nitratireducens FR1064]